MLYTRTETRVVDFQENGNYRRVLKDKVQFGEDQ